MSEVVAGWYSDPYDAQRLRWWDGQAWTEHVTEPPAAPSQGEPDALPLLSVDAGDATGALVQLTDTNTSQPVGISAQDDDRAATIADADLRSATAVEPHRTTDVLPLLAAPRRLAPEARSALQYISIKRVLLALALINMIYQWVANGFLAALSFIVIAGGIFALVQLRASSKERDRAATERLLNGEVRVRCMAAEAVPCQRGLAYTLQVTSAGIVISSQQGQVLTAPLSDLLDLSVGGPGTITQTHGVVGGGMMVDGMGIGIGAPVSRTTTQTFIHLTLLQGSASFLTGEIGHHDAEVAFASAFAALRRRQVLARDQRMVEPLIGATPHPPFENVGS